MVLERPKRRAPEQEPVLVQVQVLMVDHQRDPLLPRGLEQAAVRCVGDHGQVVEGVVGRAPPRALRRLGPDALPYLSFGPTLTHHTPFIPAANSTTASHSAWVLKATLSM